MSKAQSLVDEQVKALSSICDLEKEVTDAFHAAMLPIAERHLASLATAPAATTGEGKIKIGKKVGAKRATKPKEEKLSGKNAYHFFVADKMGEVKAAGVEAKSRMKRIGEMWKALAEDQRLPYKAMAERYNAFVGQEMKTSDWKDRKEAIVTAANASAKTGQSVPVVATAAADEEEDDEDGEIEETESVVAPAPVVAAKPVPVQVQAPVAAQAAPPAAAPAPIKRGKKATK